MATGRNKFEYNKEYYERSKRYFTDGSAAQKISVLPNENYDIEKNPYDRNTKRPLAAPHRRPKYKKVAGIDFVSTSFLAIAIAVTLYLCVQYLEVQSDTLQMNKKIGVLKTELAEVLDKNSLLEKDLAESVDPDYIFAVAVEQLGMVYPNNNDIVEYEKPAVGYVRQYSPIPKADDGGILSGLIP